MKTKCILLVSIMTVGLALELVSPRMTDANRVEGASLIAVLSRGGEGPISAVIVGKEFTPGLSDELTACFVGVENFVQGASLLQTYGYLTGKAYFSSVTGLPYEGSLVIYHTFYCPTPAVCGRAIKKDNCR